MLPKEFRLKGESVFIQHPGNCVVLVPRQDPRAAILAAGKLFRDDFMEKRERGLRPECESFG